MVDKYWQYGTFDPSTAANLTGLTLDDLGIPTGELLTAIQFDFSSNINSNPQVKMYGILESSLECGNSIINVAYFDASDGINPISGSADRSTDICPPWGIAEALSSKNATPTTLLDGDISYNISLDAAGIGLGEAVADPYIGNYILDVIPCVTGNSSSYISGSDPTALCADPAVRVTSLSIDYSDELGGLGGIVSVEWWTNEGSSGKLESDDPFCFGTCFINNSPSLSDLDIPSGEWLTALRVNYKIPSVGPYYLGDPLGGSVDINVVGTPSPSLEVGDIIRNTAWIQAAPSPFTEEAIPRTGETVIVGPPTTATAVGTSIVDNINQGTSVAYYPGNTITWKATYTAGSGTTFAPRDPVQPDWYIAIPIGLQYVPGSINFTNLPAGLGQPEILDTSPGTDNLTGYTILHLRWPDNELIGGVEGQPNPFIEMTFDTLVEPNVAQGTYSAQLPNNGGTPLTNPGAIYSVAYAANDPNTLRVSGAPLPDAIDFDDDENVSEQLDANFANWRVDFAAAAYARVLVRANSPDYSYFDNGEAGGNASYQLNIMNASNDGSVLTDFVYYASLPRIGDGFVGENFVNRPRETEFPVYMTGPVVAPPNTTVMYSTGTNPCRNEVYPDSENTDCVDDWVSENDITDWSDVVFMKFVMSGEYAEGEGELFTIPVVIDEAAEPDQIAWLSMAYQAFNADTNMVLMAAEPPRVGLAVIAGEVPPECNPAEEVCDDTPTCDPTTEQCDNPDNPDNPNNPSNPDNPDDPDTPVVPGAPNTGKTIAKAGGMVIVALLFAGAIMTGTAARRSYHGK